MDPLQEALQMLDEACAIIQELVAQSQTKGQEQDMSKKAEEIALKLGISFDRASDMIKTASEDGADIESIVKAASFMKKTESFGRVFTEENQIPKTGSKATDSYLEKEAEIMAELDLN